MGGKTPTPTKREVIRRWLEGDSRDQIAKDNDIGGGTVSSIIKECREHDPDFDLLRQVAFTLKREGLNVAEFASTIRLKWKMEQEIGLNEEQLETFIGNLNIHCFKRGAKEQEFLGTIDHVFTLSNNLSVPVDQLPSYIALKKKEVEFLNQDVDNIRRQRYEQLLGLGTDLNDFEEYRRNRPLF